MLWRFLFTELLVIRSEVTSPDPALREAALLPPSLCPQVLPGPGPQDWLFSGRRGGRGDAGRDPSAPRLMDLLSLRWLPRHLCLLPTLRPGEAGALRGLCSTPRKAPSALVLSGPSAWGSHHSSVTSPTNPVTFSPAED